MDDSRRTTSCRFRHRLILIVAAIALSAAAIAGPPLSRAQTISVVGQLTLPDAGKRESDVWGWVDPNTNIQYAAVGQWPSTNGKVFIINVSDPTNPTLAATIDSVPSFDLKTFRNYLYLCDGNGTGIDSEIWDISDPTNPTFVNTFPSCHNIYIDDVGLLYLAYNTTRIYNLLPDPENPEFVWTDSLSGGHDVTVVGNRMYDFHGSDGTFIYDISNIYSPVLLGSITPVNAPAIVYHHSGWTDAENGNYLFINDELGSAGVADITVWDISNPASPFEVDDYKDTTATVHNGFRVGDYYYASFYVAGFKVFDISNPLNISLADEYDTSPAFTGNGNYEGAWGVYPFTQSGHIFVSDMQTGFWVFGFSGLPTGIQPTEHGAFVLNQNFPNPFNPTTTISYHLNKAEFVSLAIYNAKGQRLRSLVNEPQFAGPKTATWDARDDDGGSIASGVYFYRLDVGGVSETKRMVLLK